MRKFATFGLSLLIVLGAACETVRASSKAEPLPASYDLPALILRTTDIPDFRVEEEGVISNDDLVMRLQAVDGQQHRFTELGRVTGYHRAFRTGNTTAPRLPVTVTTDIEQYQSSGAAKGRVRDFKPQHDLPITVEAVAELPSPRDLGQGARSLRMIVHTDHGDHMLYLVIFRRGSLVNILTTNAEFHRDDKGEDALRLSRLVDERIAAALPKR